MQVLQPAIELAEDGFPVSPVTAHQWRGCFSQLTRAGSTGVSRAATEDVIHADLMPMPMSTRIVASNCALDMSAAATCWYAAACKAKALMTADGKPPAAGQLQRNLDLAATFRRLAEHGAAKGKASLLHHLMNCVGGHIQLLIRRSWS